MQLNLVVNCISRLQIYNKTFQLKLSISNFLNASEIMHPIKINQLRESTEKVSQNEGITRMVGWLQLVPKRSKHTAQRWNDIDFNKCHKIYKDKHHTNIFINIKHSYYISIHRYMLGLVAKYNEMVSSTLPEKQSYD